MDRSPDRPPPNMPGTRPLERHIPSDATESTGSLPPWSSLGLGPDADPELDPTWWPLQGGEQGQRAPEGGPRPLPIPIRHRNGPTIVALVAAAGVIALVMYGLLRTDLGFGDDDDPGRDAGLTATNGTPVSTARVITTATAGEPAADGTGTTQQGPTATAAPGSAASPAAPDDAAVLISVDAITANGVAAADVVAGIEAALSGGNRRVTTVGPEGAANATIVVGGAPPGDGFDAQPVASRVLALVTSPRLPLFGVGADDATRLLGGEVTDWRDVGAAVSLPVEPLALADVTPTGVNATETYDDYEALVAGLADHPGGVALVPLEQVDFRVNVLSVEGIDPLRDGNIDAYRYLERLYVGVRTSQAAALQPAVDAALQGLGLPQAENRAAVTSVGVVGDIVPGRNVHTIMEERNDFTYPFQAVAGQLSSYDLTFANLEGDLSATIAQPDDEHTFAFVSDPQMIDGLKLAGIDCVTLANNHSMNFGVEGLTDTMDALTDAGVPYVGAGRDLDEAREAQFFDVNGITVALLGINGITANPDVSLPGVVSDTEGATADSPGTNPLVSDQYLADIAAAAEQADVVIPYFHMGVEYTSVPPDWAIAVAHAAIDAGATMVVANHPHWIQGMEIYKGRPIVYSLGNFIFDQMFSVEVRQGMILEITLRDDEIAGLRFHGVEIENFSRPRPMTGAEQAAIMDRFWASTDRLNEQIGRQE